ncbi:unnamed protein product [Clonostachys rhizophaga]|uniref:C2H2-type domain-containing protein n=1 Tax=Clonostachys rhizophaga TaxID=160324 RepID=A0A9N9VCS6_9HYPO|nr:unnamed protein product [Clonostachys rhizophaga]
MARSRDRKSSNSNLRPLLPKAQRSVAGQADGIHARKDICTPPQSQSLGCTASQIEASVVHTKLGATELPRHLYTDTDAGTLSVVSEIPFNFSGSLLCQDPQPSPSAFPRVEGLEGSVGCIIPTNCDTHQSSGSEHDVNDWVKKQEESFPGRLYNKLAGETHRPAGQNTDEPASQKLDNGDRDSPDLPTFFQDEMAMREYQRSSISSKSEYLIDSRISDNSDLARPGHDQVAHPVLPPPPPGGLPELRPGLDRVPSPIRGGDTIRRNHPVPESTAGQSSIRPSIWDSSSLASSSLPRTSIYGSTPSIASSRHQCTDCDKSFKLAKDLERHFQSVHARNPESYRCRCSYHTTRKDVIKRHISSSGAQRCASARPDAVDVCICKRFETSDVLWFLEHIKDCKKKPRGRPKKKKLI